jgi:two-component SAPR family response regulator
MLKNLCIFLMLLEGTILQGNNINFGLTFRSHTFNQDVRTCLDLTPNVPFDLPPGFSVSFDLKLDTAFLTYGYVFRMISNDAVSLDLIANFNTKKLNFVFAKVENVLSVLSNIEFYDQIKTKNNWMKINVQLNSDSIRCTVDSISQTIPYSLQNFKKIKIYFGKNNHTIFHTTDVPPMTIRNLIVRNSEREIIRNWEMKRHNRNEVYDEIKNSKAIAENGIWEIDRHLKWNKIQSIALTEQNAQITWDSIQSSIFIATRNSLLIYNASNNTITKTATGTGAPFRYGGSQLLFDEKNNRLISYSIQHPDFVIYDFEKKDWSDELTEYLPPIQQHNRFIDPETNQLILFGGYGNHQYKANLLRHDLDSGTWKSNDLSAGIAPRYLSAMGYLGDGELLVMGGYGNHSGKQENLPQNLYDIYKININDLKTEFVTQISGIQNPVVFSNSMIIEKEEHKIYALAYDNGKYMSSISLVSVDWKTSELNILGDSIPYRFLDTESFCDLFLHKKTATIYAVLLHKKEYSEQYCVDIYSLAYPPLSATDGLQTLQSAGVSKVLLLYIFPALSLLFAGLYLYYRKRKKIKQQEIEQKDDILSSHLNELTEPLTKKSAIFLFGGFQVFDRKGNDITDLFTPILKQIFLFLLLNSIKGKKVTSEKLDEIFWFGMDKLSASNNRSVNIRKLRLILEKIGDVTISNKNSYWSTCLGEEIICDYNEIMPVLKKLKDDKTTSNQAIAHVLRLASGGVLLPNLNAEWVDDYKSEYTDLITNVLIKATTLPDIKDDSKLLLQIANVLLLHDNIDEDAIRIKCRILFQFGQKGASKQCFDKFYAEYVRILNTKPNFEYEDIFTQLQTFRSTVYLRTNCQS